MNDINRSVCGIPFEDSDSHESTLTVNGGEQSHHVSRMSVTDEDIERAAQAAFECHEPYAPWSGLKEYSAGVIYRPNKEHWRAIARSVVGELGLPMGETQ